MLEKVVPSGLESQTLLLSVRSNQLSYETLACQLENRHNSAQHAKSISKRGWGRVAGQSSPGVWVKIGLQAKLIKYVSQPGSLLQHYLFSCNPPKRDFLFQHNANYVLYPFHCFSDQAPRGSACDTPLKSINSFVLSLFSA